MSVITNTNFLQPTGFKLVINRNKLPNLEWFAQSVDHPSLGLPQATTTYSRLTELPLIGDQLEFPEVTFNVLLDEEMNVYKEIYDWMKRLVETPYTPPLEATKDRPASEYDASLVILNSANTRQRSMIYKNAFPTNIGTISFGAEAEPTPILVPISFQYSYFEFS
jgi:hypothetical protein